ncbi:hypothetical protein OG21DRAFT_1510675 [Imleria badia]|nr:hypothetical protein OG21DRAFT_1510675 [Imleria badia]
MQRRRHNTHNCAHCAIASLALAFTLTLARARPVEVVAGIPMYPRASPSSPLHPNMSPSFSTCPLHLQQLPPRLQRVSLASRMSPAPQTRPDASPSATPSPWCLKRTPNASTCPTHLQRIHLASNAP